MAVCPALAQKQPFLQGAGFRPLELVLETKAGCWVCPLPSGCHRFQGLSADRATSYRRVLTYTCL